MPKSTPINMVALVTDICSGEFTTKGLAEKYGVGSQTIGKYITDLEEDLPVINAKRAKLPDTVPQNLRDPLVINVLDGRKGRVTRKAKLSAALEMFASGQFEGADEPAA